MILRLAACAVHGTYCAICRLYCVLGCIYCLLCRTCSIHSRTPCSCGPHGVSCSVIKTLSSPKSHESGWHFYRVVPKLSTPSFKRGYLIWPTTRTWVVGKVSPEGDTLALTGNRGPGSRRRLTRRRYINMHSRFCRYRRRSRCGNRRRDYTHGRI
jgi:hypothetical protein